MAGVPAYCPRCKIAFESNAVSVGPMARVTMINSTTKCPQCGGLAQLGDGTFSAKAGELAVENAPAWTLEILARLRQAAGAAQDAAPDSEELMKDLRAASPSLADALAPVAKSKSSWFLLLVIVWVLHNLKVNLDVNLNDLVDKAVAVAEQSHDVRADVKVRLDASINIETDASKPPDKKAPTGR
jgi:hypothetical protein